jgi:uncharacterized protein YbcI
MPDLPSAAEKEIARGTVAVYKEYLGRGPTHARAEVNEHSVMITLEDSMTQAERTLVERDDADTVREIRRKFQAAMRDEIRALAEKCTGRKSIAFLSDHDTLHDIAVEIVVFSRESPG